MITRFLDVYSCQGGASYGYRMAFGGVHATGVDKDYQERYPYTFVQGDAIQYILEHGHEYDFIHTSPPCQRDSKTQRIMSRDHPDLIGPTREALQSVGVPWVIENVVDAHAKLRNPVMLCGAAFGLRTYRHRLFEASFPLTQPKHEWHAESSVKMGRSLNPGDMYHAVGNFSGVDYVREDMGVHWMSREGIRECIPPVYSQWVGLQFLAWKEASLDVV